MTPAQARAIQGAMVGWIEYVITFAAFLAAHVVPARPGLRGALIARLGRRGYVAGFSLLSLGLLYWLILAAGRAPFVALWDAGQAGRWAVNLAMPLAILLAAAAPGMAGLIAGFVIWAGAHLVANGDLAHVLMFGVMLGFALTGAGRLRGAVWRLTPRRIAVAVAVWAAILIAHPVVIGVSPLP